MRIMRILGRAKLEIIIRVHRIAARPGVSDSAADVRLAREDGECFSFASDTRLTLLGTVQFPYHRAGQ
jgi:hypothetical protein